MVLYYSPLTKKGNLILTVLSDRSRQYKLFLQGQYPLVIRSKLWVVIFAIDKICVKLLLFVSMFEVHKSVWGNIKHTVSVSLTGNLCEFQCKETPEWWAHSTVRWRRKWGCWGYGIEQMKSNTIPHKTFLKLFSVIFQLYSVSFVFSLFCDSVFLRSNVAYT